MSKNNILKHKTIKRNGTYSYFTIGENYINLLSDYNPIRMDIKPVPSGLKSEAHTDFNPEQNINLLDNNNSIKDMDKYKNITEYLNNKARTSYKYTTRKTQQMIKARLNEGFTVKDFYRVIDNKVCEWINTEMAKYIRPETLFGKAVYPRACKCKTELLKMRKEDDERVQKQIRLNQIITNSMMNENFKLCTLENWNHDIGNEKMFKIAKAYTEKFNEMRGNNHGMLIYGDTGNGKTYSSACIANGLISKATPVICVGAIALIERINKSKRSFGDDGVFTVLNALENADLFVLDDLGTEEDSRWTRAMIYQIIEKRNSLKLPLIVTTNMSISDLRERYDERTYSRLADMCTFIRNTGQDIRKINGKEKTELFLGKIKD